MKKVETISQLIQELQRAQEMYGDIPISINDSAEIADCYADGDDDGMTSYHWFQINTTDY